MATNRVALAGAALLGGCAAATAYASGYLNGSTEGLENTYRKDWSPARSYKYRSRGGFYDNGKGSLSTWDEVLKSDNMKNWNFNDLDRDGDGFIDSNELKKAFGSNANIEKLIQQADRNGDGKIDYSEWLALKLKIVENDKLAVESLPFAAKLVPQKQA